MAVSSNTVNIVYFEARYYVVFLKTIFAQTKWYAQITINLLSRYNEAQTEIVEIFTQLVKKKCLISVMKRGDLFISTHPFNHNHS